MKGEKKTDHWLRDEEGTVAHGLWLVLLTVRWGGSLLADSVGSGCPLVEWKVPDSPNSLEFFFFFSVGDWHCRPKTYFKRNIFKMKHFKTLFRLGLPCRQIWWRQDDKNKMSVSHITRTIGLVCRGHKKRKSWVFHFSWTTSRSLQTDVSSEWMTHSIVPSLLSDIDTLSGKSVCHQSVNACCVCAVGVGDRGTKCEWCGEHTTMVRSSFIFHIKKNTISFIPSYPRDSSGPSAWLGCLCSTPRSDWWNTPGPSLLCGGEWLSSSSLK